MLQPRHPAARRIRRGFLRLPHGDVHYRTAGDGPVVLALHESPRSSLSLQPVIDALADRYQVIAMDTPGYGLSDPLGLDAPALDDFLDAIAQFLDAAGVGTVALYGAHTGAALAIAFALREPHRVTALVLDGLSAFTAEEVEAFRTLYLAPYEPHWDGRHVMGLWSRAKDLFTWFPWYDRAPAARLRHEPPGVEALHRSALGFLQAGADYTKAYILAASFRPNEALQNLRMPASVIARPDDLIADHLDRLAAGPGWEIRWLDERPGSWTDAVRDGLEQGGAPHAAEPRAVSPVGSRFLPLGEGWLHAQVAGPTDGPVRLLLAGLPGDPASLLAREAAAHPGARLVLLSPPGCGWSDPLADVDAGLTGIVAALDAAFQQMELEPHSVAGEGAGAVVARLWARSRGWPLEVEYLDPPAWMTGPLPAAPLLQPHAPGWDGAYLTTAWFQLRDLQLYDVPPGAGPPVRARAEGAPDLARLDRLFRNYVQGPDCAAILADVVDHLGRHPADGAAGSD